MAHLDELKQQFLEYVEIEKGRAVNTVENYDRYLTRFLAFLKSKNPADITDSSVREFRLWLNRQPVEHARDKTRTLTRKTQNYYLISLRAFLKYLARQGVKALPAERIELAKTPERHLDLITTEELARLMEAPNKLKGADPLKIARDKAILELLFSTGLRVSELCSLPRDIDLSVDEYSIRGKGGKVRVVFFSDKAKKALKDYLSLRKDLDDALFIHFSKPKKKSGKENGLRINKRSIIRVIKQYSTIAGIAKKVTPHTMRHMFATDLLSNGADLRSVQVLLGHANINTTQIYTHVTDRQLREVHKKFHGKR